ncbi:ABC transporter ATP-binding protein [Actinomadura sp. DC4]|uniref:ABC transporter ATP-binding protein n=1 Tax=Actinomadura sp. DC4 TaxID=3055069 RepID=UPI0025B09DA0|nr:ABC transporter ATP-binding protein [Actinomadura sp. DC4]MDN3356467.1 ABC transporter ATP-binding protein [Actinomadura sp. DC4]
MLGSPGPMTMRALGDPSVTRQRIRPGTVRKIFPYAKPYRWGIALLMLVSVFDAVITASSPLLLKIIIDNGIVKRDTGLVIMLAVIVAGLAVLDAVVVLAQRFYSSRIGEGLIYDLRTKVFRHIQQQPIAFFTRTQTGSLVSRLNTDVIEAQQAISSLLTMVVSSLLSLVLVLLAMFYLSWQVTVIALILIPLFLLPARLIGRGLQRFTRESMQLNAEMGSLMNERFNVAGAMLVKLYGRPRDESDLFGNRAARVRDINVVTAVYGRVFFIAMTLVASLATALVYGLGGSLVIDGTFQIGTLVALAALLTRLYGPINQLSTVQISVLTALVSFDRVFEVLDLKPLIAESPEAVALPAGEPGRAAPEIEFDKVAFRYPKASEISLASLESIALPTAERSGDQAVVLRDVSFSAPAGRLTALVGPSGAGKTTITHLVSRLYDPGSGTVRIDGHDLRDLTLDSLHDTIGVVTQDAHMFHDTIRGNLIFARPNATEDEVVEACRAAQIWDLISSLPNGLDTVVGDRGYRLSGGEKQRVALARLLLKAPSVVVLDEATAHLDSESEAAVQRALETALAGRTSLVIAHRLSTIREADQILVIDDGRVRERGTHDELLSRGGLYAELYHTQFARQSENGSGPAAPPPPEPPAEPAPMGPTRKRLGGGGFSGTRGSMPHFPGGDI